MRIYNIVDKGDISKIDFEKISDCKELNISMSRHQYGVVQLVVYSKYALNKVGYSVSPLISKNGSIAHSTKLLNPSIAVSPKYEETELLFIDENKPYIFFVGIDAHKAKIEKYSFEVTIGASLVTVNVDVNDEPIKHRGAYLEQSLSRLMWLNSGIAYDKKVVAGYEPIVLNGNTFKLTGKDVTLAKNGMIFDIASYFNESGTLCDSIEENLISAPMSFKVKGQKFKYTKHEFLCYENYASAYSLLKSDGLIMSVNLNISYEGKLDYVVELLAKDGVISDDISLNIPFNVNQYIIDADGKTELTETTRSDFSVPKEANGIFIGNHKAGAVVQFLSNTNFETEAEGKLDRNFTSYDSWCNFGRGYVELTPTDNGVSLTTSTGRVILATGQRRIFKFSVYLTPFKDNVLGKAFAMRDIAAANCEKIDKKLAAACAMRANAIALPVNAVIKKDSNDNFTLSNHSAELVKKAHAQGVSINIEYAPTENISTTFEEDALKQFGDEIVSSIDEKRNVCNMTSNYYLEQVNSLYKMCLVDGIDVKDDILTRSTVERLAKLTNRKSGFAGTLSAHSGNVNKPIDVADALINRIHMLPFIDRYVYTNSCKKVAMRDILLKLSCNLFGTGATFNASGLDVMFPLLFGATGYIPAYKKKEADKAMRFMSYLDNNNIQNHTMYGYWDERNPVSADMPDIYVTTYIDGNNANVVIYNDSKKSVEFDLGINPKKGFSSKGKKIFKPEIVSVQKKVNINFNKQLKLKGKRAMLIVVK